MECPQCKSDNVQRLSVIYQAGTKKINTSTHSGIGGTGIGLGAATSKTQGTQQSYLAQQAAPPKKKPLAVAILLVLAGIICCMYVHNMLLGLGLLATGAFLGYKAFTFNKDQYPGLYATWQKSWHCNKCGATYEQ